MTKEIDVAPAEIRRVNEAEQQKLVEYRLLDPEKKTVRIPIERAMEIVVRERQAKGGGDEKE